MKDKKKIVLFSGSSTRFGYDSEMIDQAFPDYEVVNMGVFAYSPALPQLELIRSCMKEGDILLDSPEFDAANRQFCYQKELDYATFAMMESDYDAFAELDLREYAQVFTAFSAYQAARQIWNEKITMSVLQIMMRMEMKWRNQVTMSTGIMSCIARIPRVKNRFTDFR